MGFMSDIVEMEPILQSLSARGIPIDETARLKLREELDAEMRALFAKMQDLVPLELRNVEPKQGYVKGVRLQPGRIEEDGSGGYKWFDSGDEDSPAMWWPMMVREFGGRMSQADNAEMPTGEPRWCRVLPFRPSGGPQGQVLRYVRHKGYAVPRTKKEDKETSDKHGLEALIRKHPKDELLPAIRAYRDVEKLKSTYVDGWKPGRDGRVHPQFHNKPATGQLSSSNPNAQNVPNSGKSPKMAALFRPIIAAGSGRVLIEFDFKSFHALTTGFEARDADWMRMARLDIHSYVAGVLLKRWEPSVKAQGDAELMAMFGEAKRDPAFKCIRDKQAKPSILGVGFGMQAHRLWKENEETIKSRAEAQALLDTLHALFPRVFRWQDEVRDLAHRQSYLVSRHGWMRWFWDVKHWNSQKGDWVNGEDSEAAIAFLPANDAHCVLKATLRRLQALGALERYGFINTIHDSLLFECPAALVDECVETVAAEMECPSEVLVDPLVAPAGLSVEVEVKIGPNWQLMNELSHARSIATRT